MGGNVDKEDVPSLNSEETDPSPSLRTEYDSVDRENVTLDEDSSNYDSMESVTSNQGDNKLRDIKELDNNSSISNITENLEKGLNITTESGPEIDDKCSNMEASNEFSDKTEDKLYERNKTEDQQTNIDFSIKMLQRQTDIRTFMNKVGLDEMYPDKITLMDVMTIQSQPETSSYKDVPMMVLKNLMMINSTSRDKMLQEFLEKIPKEDDSTENSELFNENDDIWLELGICDTHENLNPLDLLLAIFMCSSPSLKNILAAKLFMCKLAIPFLVPSETNDLILNCSLLHSIIMDDKTDKSGIRQKDALECPCHIVSFIRLGRPNISKSKLINTLLTETSHDTFFNVNCPLGTTEKNISNGLVEVSWYIPSGKGSSQANIMMFLNLRGDGQIEQKQVNCLSKISSVLVIFLEVDFLEDETTRKKLQDIQTSVLGGVILVLDGFKHDKTTIGKICSSYTKHISNENLKTKLCSAAVNKRYEIEFEVKKRVMAHVWSFLQNDPSIPFSERIVGNVGKYFTKDEDSIVHRKTIEMAKHIISDIPNNIINVKPLIAPLQGKPWQIWSKKSKLIHKASKFTSLQDMAKHEEEMKNQRYAQLDAIRNLHPFMQKCLDAFLDSVYDDSEFVLLVEWMKFLLDDRSRYVVAECLTKYQLAFQIFESAKREGTEVSEVEKDLKEKRSDLNNAPFRFEHLLRECGQIFESIKACKENASVSEQKLLTMLPKFAAKLLLIGQPLEILDGDVTHVPLLWMEAVLLQLRDLIGDKRLLALSVVGLQSSGKSTLLNTMFGLQFAVNVGRCTSGVFMQLVPVHNDSSNFDYVIVIDTEGLRSPKQDETEELSHDNMLATFVIGLGDVAMINVKGENTSEVKDILQIAVHAFLRLKLANRKLNLKQSCVFVHQNVSDSAANAKMLEERQMFVQQLDKMAKEAAEQEDIADIKTFSQIIDFNSEENVSYFSDLWHGDPPMAPVNPGYSNRVAEVKNSILNNIASKRKTYLTITDTISRIQDLWNGIIKDNFVYSFRNSLELKAYNGIEREYHSMVWEMEKFQYEFLASSAKSKLSHANVRRLDETVSEIMRVFSAEIAKMVELLTERLISFIESNKLKEVMIQWKQVKLNRLNLLSENLLIKSKTDMNIMKQEIITESIQRAERTKYEKEVNELARKLAVEMQGEKPDDKTMRVRFDEMWNSWLDNLNLNFVEHTISVKDQIEKLLAEEYPSELVFMSRTRIDSNHDHEIEHTKLEGSIQSNIVKNEHMSIRKTLDVNIQGEESMDIFKEQAVHVTNGIFQKIDIRLEEITKQDTRFDTVYVHEVFNIIASDFKSHNDHCSNDYHFNLHSTYRALIIDRVVSHMIQVFAELDQRYQSKHSPRGRLEEYKRTVWTLFVNLVEQKTEDMIIAGFIKEALSERATEQVSVLIPIMAVDKVLLSFSQEKYSLMKAIMIDLANAGNFERYISFIKEPASFARKWVSDFMYKEIFHINTDGVHHYGLCARSRTQRIFEMLSRGISETSKTLKVEENLDISQWVETLTGIIQESGVLPLSKEHFVHVVGRNVSDHLNFKRVILDEMGKVEQLINKTFAEVTSANVKWKTDVVSLIMDKLWGCEAKCMFCAEPCMNTDKSHEKHEILHHCIQHRPQGLNGFYYIRDKSLLVDFCNVLIQGDMKYHSGDIEELAGIWRKYKEYQTHYPQWDIQPTYDTSKYWMYVMCTYQHKLKDFYRLKLPHIPSSWNDITLEDAINSL